MSVRAMKPVEMSRDVCTAGEGSTGYAAVQLTLHTSNMALLNGRPKFFDSHFRRRLSNVAPMKATAASDSSPNAPTNASTLPGARSALMLLLFINLFNYIDRQVLAAVVPEIRQTFFSS